MSANRINCPETPKCKNILCRIVERFYLVLVQSDYEIIKLGNAVFLGLFALLLFFQPGYLNSSPTLAQLIHPFSGVIIPQTVWAAMMLFIGTLEFVLFIITGNPPMFSKDENDIIRWLWKGAAGFWVCGALYLFFAVTLTPPNFKFGLGNIVYGIAAFGSALGGVRSGAAIHNQKRRTSQKVHDELFVAAVIGT